MCATRYVFRTKGSKPLSTADIQRAVSTRDQSTQSRTADPNYFKYPNGYFDSQPSGSKSDVSIQTQSTWRRIQSPSGSDNSSQPSTSTGTAAGIGTFVPVSSTNISSRPPPVVSYNRQGLGYRPTIQSFGANGIPTNSSITTISAGIGTTGGTTNTPLASSTSNMATSTVADAASVIPTNSRGLESASNNFMSAAGAYAIGSIGSAALSSAGSLGSEAIKASSDQSMQQARITQELPEQYKQEDTIQTNAYNFNSQLSSQKYNQDLGLQNNEYNNIMKGYNTVMSNETNALTQAGLPSYLAYTPQALALQPKYTQLGPGTTSYTSKIPGNPTTSPYTGTTTQNALGWGAFPSSSTTPS